MIEESKCCKDVINVILRTQLNVGYVILIILMVMLKQNITEKYEGSVHIDCNIKVELNHTIPIVFHNLKNDDLHLIMQELGKN